MRQAPRYIKERKQGKRIRPPEMQAVFSVIGNGCPIFKHECLVRHVVNLPKHEINQWLDEWERRGRSTQLREDVREEYKKRMDKR